MGTYCGNHKKYVTTVSVGKLHNCLMLRLMF